MTNKEIQVGEYVRTKDGYIGKLVEQYDNCFDFDNIIEYRGGQYMNFCYLDTIETSKHSFNLIDLIEAGDYVNGYLVEATDYYEDENGNLFDTLGVVFTDDDYAYTKELKNINIHSIVTKEQFKAMEYEVEENDKC